MLTCFMEHLIDINALIKTDCIRHVFVFVFQSGFQITSQRDLGLKFCKVKLINGWQIMTLGSCKYCF